MIYFFEKTSPPGNGHATQSTDKRNRLFTISPFILFSRCCFVLRSDFVSDFETKSLREVGSEWHTGAL